MAAVSVAACALDRAGMAPGPGDLNTANAVGVGGSSSSSGSSSQGVGGSWQQQSSATGVGTTSTASGGSGGAGLGGGGGAGGGSSTQACPQGEFVVGRKGDGTIICQGVGPALATVFHNQCTLFWGWRNACEDCGNPPEKWGLTKPNLCALGPGDDNECIGATDASQTIQLFALNTDGSVNGDDTFYIGIHCAPSGKTPTISKTSGQCAKRHFVSKYGELGMDCASADSALSTYIINSLSIYFGWRDSCTGCSDPPNKWGVVSPLKCSLGAGSDSGCISAKLNNKTVQLLALNLDGDVNNDDKFYVGTHWKPAKALPTQTASACPAGQFVTKVFADGTVECRNLAPAAQDFAESRCPLYFGWRGNCESCGQAPAKWGRARGTSCSLIAGSNSGCSTATLAGTQVELLGINTDGNVDDNDVFYAGMKCY